jgi:hypothetical protein
MAAVSANADYLLTGDIHHFSHLPASQPPRFRRRRCLKLVVDPATGAPLKLKASPFQLGRSGPQGRSPLLTPRVVPMSYQLSALSPHPSNPSKTDSPSLLKPISVTFILYPFPFALSQPPR